MAQYIANYDPFRDPNYPLRDNRGYSQMYFSPETGREVSREQYEYEINRQKMRYQQLYPSTQALQPLETLKQNNLLLLL